MTNHLDSGLDNYRAAIAAKRAERDRCPPAVKAWAARFFPTPVPAGHQAVREDGVSCQTAGVSDGAGVFLTNGQEQS